MLGEKKMRIYQSCHSLLLFFSNQKQKAEKAEDKGLTFEKAKSLEERKRCRGTTTTVGPATEGTMQGTEVTQTTAKTNSSQPMGKHACTSIPIATKLQTNYLSLFLSFYVKQHQLNDTALI